MKYRITRLVLMLLLLGLPFSGCMSAKSHREKADKAAAGIISAYQQEALGRTEPFTIEENADNLRRELMITQDLPGHVSGVSSNDLLKSGKPLEITLLDAMQIAARNSRLYQAEKEKVFGVALDLDLTRSEYQNSYAGLISGLFSSSGSDDGTDQQMTYEGSTTITRKLQSGATLSTKLGLDLVKLLTLDKTTTFGIFADATISIPLLRGAGRDIAREPLTQAERNVVYAIWEFERFKKTFAVDIAGSYLKALETGKQIQNAEANYKSIVATRERVAALAEAGRTSQAELDQAAQNELTARNSLVSTKQRLATQMDAFKEKLGLPIDARIDLEPSDLVKLSKKTKKQLQAEPSLSVAAAEREASAYVVTALSNRLDMATARDKFTDARRKRHVAEDALDPDMKLQLTASTRQTDISGASTTFDADGTTTTTGGSEVDFGDGSVSALLQMDLPWNRTKERTAFRKSLIALRAAERAIEAKNDEVKKEIRGAARQIIELKETYLIQQQAVALAEKRVESTELFLQAGTVSIRDVLEAQEDLVEARDKLVSAIVSYHIATLNLRKDLGLLEVNEKGLWRNND